MDVVVASHEFELPVDRVWLNAAHQGPLPRRAATAVEKMVRWKTQPHHLQPSCAFTELPTELRRGFARLIGAHPSEVTIANSASYGLHLVANGLDLREGDEVVVASNDFPSDILPWLRLEHRGVVVRQIEPVDPVATADEVASVLSARTQAICLTWVHSFSGHVLDLEAIGSLCREADALFVVNGSQGVGAIPLNVRLLPIDVLTTVGFKWLCGPYGTGFCWLGDRACERVGSSKLYWLTALSTDDLTQPDLDLSHIDPPKTGRHDIFGTANFFNNAALVEAVDLIDKTGVAAIHQHNLALAEQLASGLDPMRFEVQARGPKERLSSILFVRPSHEAPDEAAVRLGAAGIDVAERSGMIRLSPHLYNTETEIDRALHVINER